jgi:hypothetical protein
MRLSNRLLNRRNHLPILDVPDRLCDFCGNQVTRMAYSEADK